MSYLLNNNIRFLRRQKQMTQEQLAAKLGVNRAALGSYEEGRAEPRLAVLQSIAQYFGYSIDDLVHKDLSVNPGKKAVDIEGKTLRILPVMVDAATDKERIAVVPVKAAAGYLNGYSDVDFIAELPSFSLPLPELARERSYRLFQVKGESMLPVPSGAYIIGEYVQNWARVKDNDCYILITRDEGLVYKRVQYKQETGSLLLISDNPEYAPYEIETGQVLEMWKASGYISLQIPQAGLGCRKAARW